MEKNLERELKVFLTKEEYEKLLHSYDFTKQIIQTNVYYDTPDGKIKDRKGALRIRFVDGKKILTIKLPHDETSKKEYERETQASDPFEFSTEEWQFIHSLLPEAEHLEELCQFTTTRNLLYLPEGEFCLDKTDFGKITDYEIEYEYHTDHDGVSKLNEFLIPAGISYKKQSSSKLARAMNYKLNL